MPQPRKPTKVLQFSGAYRKNPKRAASRINEPEPSGEIGSPPEHLTDGQAVVWREIIALSLPGVLGNADRFILEQLACAVACQRTANAATHGLGYDVKLGAYIKSCCEQLGMTPAARSKVQAKEGATVRDDSFAAI